MRFSGTQKGFTLIELMIIIVLVAIMAMFAVPSFTQLINNNRTQSASNELAAMFQYARTYAVEHRTPTWVCISGGTVAVKANCDATTAALRTMAPNINVDLTPGATQIQFHGNGSAAIAGTVNFFTCHDGDEANGFTVAVMTTGNIRTYARGKQDATNAISEC